MPIVYQVWVIDCDECGTRIDYGEDEWSCPGECEECGAQVDSDRYDGEAR